MIVDHKIRGPRDKHPSGRPGSVSIKKARPYLGFNDDYYTPRMRQRTLPGAIGFTAGLVRDDKDDK